MSKLDDENLRWLIEQTHNDFLTWVALWLACMLGIVTILTTLASRPEILTNSSLLILFSLMFWGLVIGSVSSVFRLTSVVKLGVKWMNKLESKALKTELLSTRGWLSKYIVRGNGELCRFNLSLVIIIHFAFALGFFIVSFQFI